jgi:hypothetical protein
MITFEDANENRCYKDMFLYEPMEGDTFISQCGNYVYLVGRSHLVLTWDIKRSIQLQQTVGTVLNPVRPVNLRVIIEG